MSTAKVVPTAIQLAAKRAFVRTTAQAYAATIPAGGISATAVLALVENTDPVVIAVMAAAAVLSPPLAGLAAYASMIAGGIPLAYRASLRK